MRRIQKLIYTILSISGFVPNHLTLTRLIFMGTSVWFSIAILPQFFVLKYAIGYFLISTILYIGFIYLVLPKKGLRLNLIKKFGEEKAYLYYEGFLAFAFLHNGISLSFISQSSAGYGPWDGIPSTITIIIAILLTALGLGTKIWAAYVVGIPIYYWKDMFLGRKIQHFVVSGPYKYFANPMYGIGQLQVYAIALYYESFYGLLFGAINQSLIFLFYLTVEKSFIKRTYVQPKI